MSEEYHTPRVLLLSAVGTRTNPYLGLLQGGLAAAGADVRLTERLGSADLTGAARPDVIHLHWLDRYDLPQAILFRTLHGAADLPRRALRRLLETGCNVTPIYQMRRWRRLRRLVRQLRGFQATGGRVAYTIHNLDPHEDQGPADRWGNARLIRLADVVHVHDDSTAHAVAERFGRRGRVAVIPHGHYLDSYPNQLDRVAARTRLGLPAHPFLYVTLGLLRPYKGLEALLAAFRSLPDEDVALLLAGKPESDSYGQALATLAAADSRIRLQTGFVPQEEVQLYLNAADVCVLPYRQITTSGAALLAFSFGVPVIAPAIGAFPNLVGDRRGILYDPANPTGLAHALAQARTSDWQTARQEILDWVRQFDWTEIGQQLVRAYG